MATWSEKVSRRRGLASYSEKEYGYGVVVERGRRCGRSMRDDVTASVEGRGRERLKDRDHMPVEKKRKISANDWDKEDKGIRVSMNSMSSKAPSSVVSDMSRDPSSGESTVTECSGTSPSFFLPRGLCVNGGQERKELEEDEFVERRDIFMSRWASESNSPSDSCVSDDEDVTKRMEVAQSRDYYTHISSPESGEVLREGSEHYKVNEEEYTNELNKNDNLEVDEDINGKLNSSVGAVDTDPKQDVIVPNRCMNMLESCRSVFEYEKLNKINEGTYGVVYRAKDKQSREIVALKKVKMGVERNGGFPLSSLREINILSSFDHPSIVNVKEVVMGDLDNVFMVMEYMEHDLKGMLDVMKQPFSTSEVKCLMLQLLNGVSYLHDNWVLHRDLKSSNILLDNKGGLKICDFGLSRQYGSQLKPYTPVVVTLWYRAPELLLGSKQYSTAIDMWSVGCIMAEMLNKEPLFQGKSEVDQLDKIFRTLGTPNETVWPGLSKLPGAGVKFVRQPFNQLRKKFPAASFTGSPFLSESGMDLMNKLLAYDPETRITAEAALDHDWFREVPLPKCKDLMPTFPAQNVPNTGGKR